MNSSGDAGGSGSADTVMPGDNLQSAFRLGAQRQALQAFVACDQSDSRSNIAFGIERALTSCSRKAEG
jgi:hypothetical protein